MATTPKTTITGSEATDAFDLTQCSSIASFMITGATGGTVTPQYSNKRGTKVDADWSPSPTAYSSYPTGPWELPFGIAKFVRFKGTGVTGTAWISFGPALDSNGKLYDIGVEVIPTPQVTS